ncbi:DUF7511 domain-containing protein [Halomarina litorea]|uniref:DUF7511 domain-containing protein n=1 Tax=Halomarina litorea TaxID=2961595 RepID=UPI0020C52396|nr:hypothetical protein [Halomarina sp. BCD28]
MSAEHLLVPAGLVQMEDPDDPSLITICESDATGLALASRWLTVSDDCLVDTDEWR